MKYALPLFLLSVFVASLALPQSNPAPVPGKTPVKKTTPKKPSTTKKTASSKTASSKKNKSAKKPAATAAAYRQTTPTPQRYQEIQQALADKGYLKSEPNGVWDTQSADALRQFQTERKLSPTGKLSSASLIALGLGPKTAPAPPASTAPAGAAPAGDTPPAPNPTPEN